MVETFIVALIALAVFASGFRLRKGIGGKGVLPPEKQTGRNALLEEAAGELGLDQNHPDGWSGRFDNRHVFLSGEGATLRVEPPEGFVLAPHLSAKHHGNLENLTDLPHWWRGDIPTGDTGFDHSFHLDGKNQYVVALFNHESRELLHRLKNPEIDAHGLTVQMPPLPEAAEDAREVLQAALDLCGLLSRNQNLKELLIENVRRDPLAEVRSKNLALLLKRYPLDEVVFKCLINALQDPSTEVKLLAVEVLHERAIPHTATLLQTCPPEQAVGMLKHVAPLQDNEMRDAVRSALHNDRSLPAALAVLDHAPNPKVTDALICIYRRTDALGLRLKITETIGRQGGKKAASFLAELLQRSDRDLRAAAAKGLARCGGLKAVEPLHAAMQKSRGGVKKALADAIRQIQERHGQGEKGWLSMKVTDSVSEGALSNPLAVAAAAEKGGLSPPSSVPPGSLQLPGIEPENRPTL